MSLQIEESKRSDQGSEVTFSDVSVVMGTYNEEAAIKSVITEIQTVTDGNAEITCVDGSSDRTPEIARDLGATVIKQEPQGYGVAVREALLTPDRPVVITTDCDDTYPMEHLPKFQTAINHGYDVVSDDHLSHGANAMPTLNRYGNIAFALVASALIGRRIHDTTTGMRAYRRDVSESITWTENTGLSAELFIRALMRGYQIRELPIEYRERAGASKLDPLGGGAAIVKSIVKVCHEEQLGIHGD
ncbi:dolichyl-phosphate hexose transferase [Haladaptatus salinisoli]|uniref:dolichyl-phosphate hexose transferase n=1 Tax=Haladaptatus salinisoli TaxID=2884876 RepID=UPI001D0B12A2|nr:dolichyl-phosphate hexose transferase [Haladaptatus salinisoli]